MEADWEASRRLLRRVRDVMAAEAEPQTRLDRLTQVIAAELVAEVCSIYVRRGADRLLLFASHGLKHEAVHVTQLHIGEGLVGRIARTAEPLVEADAQANPHFAYRPETGEEIYHSLMGVPVMRDGRVRGVLVVQNRTRRNYREDEVESLQTVAMVLAEIIAGSGLPRPPPASRLADPARRPVRLAGQVLSRGLAIGEVILYDPRLPVREIVAEDVSAELERLATAFISMSEALEAMFSRTSLNRPGEHREVLEAYQLIAADAGWRNRIEAMIRSGLSAEGAVQRVQDDMHSRMARARDAYLRERLADLDDLSRRLLVHLRGDGEPVVPVLPDNAVLVARQLGPAELLDQDLSRLRAVVLEEGAAHTHAAIIARALDIPMLGQVDDLMEVVEPGDRIVVDGDHAQVLVRPSPEIEQTFEEGVKARGRRRALYAQLRDVPAITADAQAVSLLVNAGLLIDLEQMHVSAASGVGLYRTEVPFMVRRSFPDVSEQTELYRRVLEAAGDRPVVFRTLDIGGDKLLPYWRLHADPNPAMGWRALRVALDRPFVLRDQLRALLCAAAGRTLSVMFPMVTEVSEFRRARAILDAEVARLRRRGAPLPEQIRVGAMLEVPALAFQLPALLRVADFISVGSNDLLQFLLAADRGNARVGSRYDTLSPAVLTFLRHVIRTCDAAGVPVTFCGEMAGQPLEAMALLGLGVRRLSMPPPAVGPVKLMVRSLHLSPLSRYLHGLLDSSEHTLRGKLHAYALDHDIAVD